MKYDAETQETKINLNLKGKIVNFIIKPIENKKKLNKNIR